jgi:uncharacterized protein YkwD
VEDDRSAARRAWLRIIACICAVAATMLLLVAPGAGAAAHASRPHKHHKHHKKHKKHTGARSHQSSHSASAPGTCPGSSTPATNASVATMDAAVVCLVNQERQERGLPALTVADKLNRSAQAWNDEMIRTGNFTHGSNFAGRISAVGYNWQTAGENIATGYLTPDQAVSAWMASTGHCQNILDPSFRNVGSGETPSPVGTWASGPATWTQDFGLLMSQSPLSSNHGPQDGCPYS